MNIPAEISLALTKKQHDFIDHFFRFCPSSFLSSLILKSYQAGQKLISSDDGCAHVYILLSGRLQAIEERVSDEDYLFTELSAIEIVGDFELFTKASQRIITLTTLEPSLCLIIPATEYLAWIRTDSNALFIRIQMLISQFTVQTQLERSNFFLDNRTRLIQLLADEYGKYFGSSLPDPQATAAPLKQSHLQPQICLVKYKRAEIAGKLGCSLRTVNRLVSQLHAEGGLELVHGKIRISPDHYSYLRTQLHSFNATSIVISPPFSSR